MFSFDNPYNQDSFINFLEAEFLPEDFRESHEELDFDVGQRIKKVHQLGKISSLENLKVFEIHHESEHDPRVTLTRESFNLIKRFGVKNALAAFVSDNSDNYRFSLITSSLNLTEEGQAKREFSNPRRYSFLMGPEAKVKTPEMFLRQRGRVAGLEDLQDRFDIKVLTKKFYNELSNWYFWALNNVKFPEHAEEQQGGRNMAVIRMITRLVFIWFMKERDLVPDKLFNYEKVKNTLKTVEEGRSTYYKAILQNLFFATLNTPQEDRRFREQKTYNKGWNKDFGNHDIYRYEEYFEEPDSILEHFKNIPFLNGGIFECLDQKKEKPREYIDGFTRTKKYQPKVPNFLFFGEERKVDLSEFFEKGHKSESVRGLVNILDDYNFTIDESTPIDKEISLDPELLGHIFENLLASYNPETATTARKATGSYYTPRSIVEFMTEESLKQHFFESLENNSSNRKELKGKIEDLLSYHTEGHEFNKQQVDILVDSIYRLKIIDPAVGSGAFPMGVLQKLVLVLSKLDPENKKWKKKQVDAVKQNVDEEEQREKLLRAIENDFRKNRLDYTRKRYLIRQCIYGVDIQPIAIQIAKLRFFISLLVDEDIDKEIENKGVEPLPNLETNFVAANTLITLKRSKESTMGFKSEKVKNLENTLRSIRSDYFLARTKREKDVYKKRDQEVREKLIEELKRTNFLTEESRNLDRIANWNPYDTNNSAGFFDTDWMFGVSNFDLVIGNPPFGKNVLSKDEKSKLNYYDVSGCGDICGYFVEREMDLLKDNGAFANVLAGSIVVNQSTHPVREIMRNNGSFKMSFFGTRPARLFPGNEKRVSITVGQVGLSKPLKTSRNLRFTEEQREELFIDLHFSTTKGLLLGSSIGGKSGNKRTRLPKIGSKINREILLNLKKFSKKNKKIGDSLNAAGRFDLQYRQSGGYWLAAMDKIPYESTKIDTLSFNNKFTKDIVKLIINSSLFYFFWCVYGNNRDLQKSLITSFPINSENNLSKYEVEIEKRSNMLEKKLNKVFDPNTGRVGEFDTGKIKSFLDKIDLFLSEVYGLSKDKIEHVINYDSHLRNNRT